MFTRSSQRLGQPKRSMPIATLSPPIAKNWHARECMKTPERSAELSLPSTYVHTYLHTHTGIASSLTFARTHSSHHSCIQLLYLGTTSYVGSCIYRHPAKQLLAIGDCEHTSNEAGASGVIHVPRPDHGQELGGFQPVDCRKEGTKRATSSAVRSSQQSENSDFAPALR